MHKPVEKDIEGELELALVVTAGSDNAFAGVIGGGRHHDYVRKTRRKLGDHGLLDFGVGWGS